MTRSPNRDLLGVVLALVALGGAGCASGRSVGLEEDRLDEAIATLTRPLPGDFAGLYAMRMSRSGGFRLAVITAGDGGRMTVSEPFGAAISLTAWSTGGPAVFFDMEAGCRRPAADVEEVLGVRAVPLAQAVRLLGGRLPALAGDDVVPRADGDIELVGDGWAARVRVAPDPWRVQEVAEVGALRGRGWRIELDDHTSSVPGRIRVENVDGRWVELELTRMEWPESARLPDLPDFPECGRP